MGGDVADAGVGSEAAQGAGDAELRDGAAAFDQEPVGTKSRWPVFGDPVVEEF